MKFAFLLFAVSIVLLALSPKEYSMVFCQLTLGVFLMSGIHILRKTAINQNFFNFHTLFFIGFFAVNFIYPNFIYPINPEYFWMFSYSFNEANIPVAIALSLVAFCSYTIGVLYKDYRSKKKSSTTNNNINKKSICDITKFILLILSVFYGCFVVYTGTFNSNIETINSELVSTVVIFFSAYILINNSQNVPLKRNIFLFIKSNTVILFSALIVTTTSFWFGDRGPVIQILIILMYIYSAKVNSISKKALLLFMIIGFISMTFISSTRTDQNSLRSGAISKTMKTGIEKFSNFESFWDFGMDLIINARSAYVAFEIVEEEGYLYGKSYFPNLLSPIPYLPALVTEFIFDKSPLELSTSSIITKRAGVYEGGLGTNAVGDTYMNFGVIGTILLFFLFGFIVRWSENSNNTYVQLIYLLLISLAIYFPRASLFENFSTIVRAVLILYLLNFFAKYLPKKPNLRNYEHSNRI